MSHPIRPDLPYKERGCLIRKVDLASIAGSPMSHPIRPDLPYKEGGRLIRKVDYGYRAPSTSSPSAESEGGCLIRKVVALLGK